MTNLAETIKEATKASEDNVAKRRLALECAAMLAEEKTDAANNARTEIMNWLADDATGR